MKIFLKVFFLCLFAVGLSFGDVFVNGYTRSDGTYVKPHYRSSPNSTRNDNYSTFGNINPHTYKPGTKSRDNSLFSGW